MWNPATSMPVQRHMSAPVNTSYPRRNPVSSEQAGLLAHVHHLPRLPVFRQWHMAGGSHSQWRDRAGFAPVFPFQPIGS